MKLMKQARPETCRRIRSFEPKNGNIISLAKACLKACREKTLKLMEAFLSINFSGEPPDTGGKSSWVAVDP